MNYVIFEDMSYKNFLPFTYLRFTGDMRVGVLKLRQRLGLYFDFEPNNIVIRRDLEDLYKKKHSSWQINLLKNGEYIFLNSRLKHKEIHIFNALKIGQKLVSGNDILAFRIKLKNKIRITAEELETLYLNLEPIEINDIDCLWNFNWEFIQQNGNYIKEDFNNVFYEEDNFMSIDPGVVALNPYHIWIGEGAQLQHGVILDATLGPIIIDEGAHIMFNSVIIGPAYIGKKSIIKIGTKVYSNTAIGPNCKVGGEIGSVIFQAYSNKQHDGFLGNSYIGEWVNIGAGTNNSDLKNNYNNVSVYFYPENRKISTNDLFLGCFIGDHSKIGINCTINTGTVLGFGVNLYGSNLIKDYVPSFTWGDSVNIQQYDFTKFIETARIVKERRDCNLSSEEIEMMKRTFEGERA